MSKPFAAKGVGACFLKRVLNTRLLPVALVRPGRAGCACAAETPARARWGTRQCGVAMTLNAGSLTSPVPAGLAEGDPLPPEDRATVRSKLTLEELYFRMAPRLLRFFARNSAREDAHDLVHESFMRLADADALGTTAIREPEAYLKRIATNLLRSRAKSALQRSLAAHVPVDEERLPAPDPVAALEARDLLDRVQRELLRLSPKTRAIFLAHRVDGQSYNDIAKQTGLGVRGVEWHMAKAIRHLDRALRAR